MELCNYPDYLNIAINNEGNFIVVWSDEIDDHSGRAVNGKIFNLDGSPATGKFIINERDPNSGREPSVDINDEGDFAVVWHGGDLHEDMLYYRAYNASGQPTSPAQPVNEQPYYFCDSGHVVMLSDGRFMIVWNEIKQKEDTENVMAQLYDLDGEPIGDRILLHHEFENFIRISRVAKNDADEFLIAWDQFSSPGKTGNRTNHKNVITGYDIYFQRFYPDGYVMEEPYKCNQTNAINLNEDFDVAISNDWSIFAAWRTYNAVAGRVFGPNADPVCDKEAFYSAKIDY